MKNKIQLTLWQRIVTASIYVTVFVLIAHFFTNDFTFLFDSNAVYNKIFVSVVLLLIFGSYIAEPFFTKPTDILVNSTSILLFLLSIDSSETFVGYEIIKYSALSLILLSVVLILISNIFKNSKWQEVFIDFVVKIGQSKVSYSVLYLALIFSYFTNEPKQFAILFTFWVIFITRFLVEGFIDWVTKVFKYLFKDKNSSFIGEAIGYENPYIFKVEVNILNTKVSAQIGDLVSVSLKMDSSVFGVIIDQKTLLNRKWLTVYLFKNENETIKDTSSVSFLKYNNLLSKNYNVSKVDVESLSKTNRDIIEENYLYKNRQNVIGYVEQGSDIGKIRFYILANGYKEAFSEGLIVSTFVKNKPVLYQIIDASTKDEDLGNHDSHSYISVIAKKLGEYKNKEIETVTWLPEMYSPVFRLEKNISVDVLCKNKDIGTLPGTNFTIEVKDFNFLVTHNTAILGILGIGKSCLTFELIKKVVHNTEAKIICIDITNEYSRKLIEYIDGSLIEFDTIGDTFLTELKTSSLKKGSADDSTQWGNKKEYEGKLKTRISDFNQREKRVLILNPDIHAVAEACADYKITHHSELTVAQKTRIISEQSFMVCKENWDSLTVADQNTTKDAKILIVYEEAHSLIPEWNSSANKGDGDASNGTARVILQGRKYGLGSFVITQRTANISKSILNQCNTVFAMRIFDDTGKQFLENYIGSDYANTLPTLEPRHAICIGKALNLKQPIVIKLNDMSDVIIK